MQPSNSEEGRINFLLQRDGLEDTQEWIERTLNIYREGVNSLTSHVSKKEYRPLYERSIKEFEEWLLAHQKENSRDAKI
jgi:hypothetical protein